MVTRIKKGLLIIALAFMGILAMASVKNIFDMAKAEWYEMEGIILSVDVLKNETSKGVNWCPRVEYKYSYKGQEYINDKINNQCNLSEKIARNRLLEYTAGNEVSVFFPVQTPDKARLVRGYSLYDWGLPILLVMGFIMMLPSYRIIFGRHSKLNRKDTR